MTAQPAPQFEFGELYHIGMAVRDIGAEITRLSDLGVAQWGPAFDLSVRPRDPGEPDATMKVAFSVGGPVQFELVQPLGGQSPAALFLAERGEGVDHFGYWVEDMEAAVSHGLSRGMTVAWQGSDDGGLAVVFLTDPALFGVRVELVRREPRINIPSFRFP
jgi:hypothetical protein